MYGKLGKFVSYVVCVVFLCLATSLSFAASSVEIARDLLDQYRNQEAYDILKQDDASMGQKTYDLLLGQIASNISKPDESAVACERVAINEPDNIDAKFCLAKAYFDLGQYRRSREILFSIDSQRHNHYEIQELKDQINKKINTLKRPWRIYGKFNAGWDSNVTTATNGDYINTVPLNNAENIWKVPEWVLDQMKSDLKNWSDDDHPIDIQAAYAYEYELYKNSIEAFRSKIRSLNRKLSSPYISPQIGINGHHKLNNIEGIWYWDTNLQHRLYSNEADFDISKFNIALGINQPINQLYLLDAALYYQEYLFSYKRYRKASVIMLGLSKSITLHNILRLYIDNGILNYAQQKQRNVYDYAGGFEWKYAHNKNFLSLKGFIGRQQPRFKSGAAHYRGNNYYGAKLTGTHKLTKKFSFGTELTYQHIQFDAKRFENGNIRRDSFYDMSISTRYNLKPCYDWYVQCTYTNNNSNLFLYKYDRVDLFTGISFKF
jgi:hypothetical protein